MAWMKRLVKLSISCLVRACDATREACRRPLREQCIVVYYHTIPSQFRSLFARQLDLLLELAQPVSTAFPSVLEPGKRYVCVTFDDGFLSVKENAAPELSRRKIPWTLFVPSGCLGKKPDW